MFEIIKLDLEPMYTRVGSTYVKQRTGWPQGSPLGPFIACLCASFYEFRIGVVLTARLNPLTKLIMRRWIDDTYCIIVAPKNLIENELELFRTVYDRR